VQSGDSIDVGFAVQTPGGRRSNYLRVSLLHLIRHHIAVKVSPYAMLMRK
jgi:hypothetical protein